jgi:hypothetical protein
MAWFLIFSITVLCIVFLIFLIQIPILIARGRGLSGSDLTTIMILSWCGLIFGVTWFVALILSLVWRPGANQEDCGICGKSTGSAADQIERLHKLKQRGAITQKEFDSEKKKILSK